jgi:hypothetical protein
MMTEAQGKGEFVKLADVEKMISEAIAKRDKEHEAELAKVRATVPVAIVPTHGGGPGTDNHRPSWSLAAQEAAHRGEDYPEWHDES